MASSWREIPTDKDGLLLKHQWLDRRFRYEDKNVAFTNVQPHYYTIQYFIRKYANGWIHETNTNMTQKK